MSARCHKTLWRPCELLELRETLLESRVRSTVNSGRKCMPSERRTWSLDDDVEVRLGRLSRIELVRTVPLVLITILVRTLPAIKLF